MNQEDWYETASWDSLTEKYQTKLLDTAIALAVKHHFGQCDRAGGPYILHPLHLMNQAVTSEEKIVAVLHDTIEDTPLTLKDLKEEGFPAVIVDALRLLTHDKDVPYDAYVEKISANPLARTVKMLDLRHNMDLTRLNGVTDKDLERVRKYSLAYARLKKSCE